MNFNYRVGGVQINQETIGESLAKHKFIAAVDGSDISVYVADAWGHLGVARFFGLCGNTDVEDNGSERIRGGAMSALTVVH